jgi:hypothetical protein
MEHCMQIQSNCIWYSIVLREFANRTQITFGSFAKGICYPWNVLTKAKRLPYLMNIKIAVSLGSFWTTVPRTNKTFKYEYNIMAAILCMNKIEHHTHICLRNPRIACSTDHVNNIPLRELNLNLKETTFKNLCTIRDPCPHQGLPNHTTFRSI